MFSPNLSDQLFQCCIKIENEKRKKQSLYLAWAPAHKREEKREKEKNRGERRESGVKYSHYTGLCNLQLSAFVCVSFACMRYHGSNRHTEPNWVRKGIL